MIKKLLRILFYLYLVYAVSGFSAWVVWHAMSDGPIMSGSMKSAVIQFAEFPSKVFHFLRDTYDKRKIPVSKTIDKATFYNNKSTDKKVFLLLPTFTGDDSIEVKLLNPTDHSIKKRWVLSEDDTRRYTWKLFKNTHVRIGHPMMLKDSSIIFTCFSLFRLGKDNSIIWSNNQRIFHHAIQIDEDSTIWTGSVINGNKYFNYGTDTLENNAICALDLKTGVIKYEKSIADILSENNFMMLLKTGQFESDAIHLNDIEPVLSNSDYWKKGDLFISLRNLSTILLYRPSTNKVIWLKTGPWLAQHDVDIVDNQTIMIFGNDVLRGKKKSYLVNGHNDIYFYDFKKDSVYLPYTKIMKNLGVSTPTAGRCDFLPNGDLYVDETDNGKIYIIDTATVKMKYYERINDKYIKMFSWGRPIF